MYADDTQLYDSSTLVDAESVRDRLTSCISEVAKWCASRRLQMNAEKTEMIWFGSRSSVTNFNASTSRSTLEPTTSSPAVSSVIWVYLDSELSMKHLDDKPLTDMIVIASVMCIESADKCSIFTVLKRWLLQQRETETEVNVVFIIPMQIVTTLQLLHAAY